MGGACAEIATFGDYDREGSETDLEWAQERLQRLGYTDNGKALWRGTINLLRRHVGLITSVALRLEQERVLDGRTIDRIVARG
jgi:hypothetical protein